MNQKKHCGIRLLRDDSTQGNCWDRGHPARHEREARTSFVLPIVSFLNQTPLGIIESCKKTCSPFALICGPGRPRSQPFA